MRDLFMPEILVYVTNLTRVVSKKVEHSDTSSTLNIAYSM